MRLQVLEGGRGLLVHRLRFRHRDTWRDRITRIALIARDLPTPGPCLSRRGLRASAGGRFRRPGGGPGCCIDRLCRLFLRHKLGLQLLDPGCRLLGRAHSVATVRTSFSTCDRSSSLLTFATGEAVAGVRRVAAGCAAAAWRPLTTLAAVPGELRPRASSWCWRSWHAEPWLTLSSRGLERAVDDVLDALAGLV